MNERKSRRNRKEKSVDLYDISYAIYHAINLLGANEMPERRTPSKEGALVFEKQIRTWRLNSYSTVF